MKYSLKREILYFVAGILLFLAVSGGGSYARAFGGDSTGAGTVSAGSSGSETFGTDGSGSGISSSSDVNVYTSYNYLPVGSYDSADIAIIQSLDFEERKVTLYNVDAARSYTLNYDGTTYVSDKYGTAMSIEQLNEGMIVNVNCYKSTRQLVDIQISPDAWTYDSVTRYNLGGINSTATIGDRTYALTKGVQVFSEFNGSLTEQFVLQELSVQKIAQSLYYWSEGATSEVDFIFSRKNMIVPVEAKAGLNVHAQSLKVFRKKYAPRIAVRTSLRDIKLDEGLLNIPLYELFNLGKILDTQN